MTEFPYSMSEYRSPVALAVKNPIYGVTIMDKMLNPLMTLLIPDIIPLMTMTIMKISTIVAITFPHPILPISLKASGMFKAYPKLSVLASLAPAIVWMNEKIKNNTTATIPVMVIAVPSETSRDCGMTSVTSNVVFAGAIMDA